MPNNDLLKNLRAELLSPSLSLSYNDPIHVVRGESTISLRSKWYKIFGWN